MIDDNNKVPRDVVAPIGVDDELQPHVVHTGEEVEWLPGLTWSNAGSSREGFERNGHSPSPGLHLAVDVHREEALLVDEGALTSQVRAGDDGQDGLGQE